MERKNTPRMGARAILYEEGRGRFVARVRSVSTPGAVQWPRLSSGITYETHPRLWKELCPGKGVTSVAEIAPPHISARTRFERWWKGRRGAKDSLFRLIKRANIYIVISRIQRFVISFFFLYRINLGITQF